MTKEIESISCQQTDDDVGDISYLQQCDINSKNPDERQNAKQDKKRLEAYYNNEWHFVGIQAVAEIRIDGLLQTISSGGNAPPQEVTYTSPAYTSNSQVLMPSLM